MNTVIQPRHMPPTKYRSLDIWVCRCLAEWAINLAPLIKSFARKAIISTQKIAQPVPSKSPLFSQVSVSRGHFHVNCRSILSSCKFTSDALMKTVRIQIWTPMVDRAAIQPKMLSPTKYLYTESLPMALKAYMSSLSLILLLVDLVKFVPLSLYLPITYNNSVAMQHNTTKNTARTPEKAP